MEAKKYGLIIPSKIKQSAARPVRVVAPWNDDDDEEYFQESGPSTNQKGTTNFEANGSEPKRPSTMPQSAFSASLRKKNQAEISAALAEDPNVFAYDEVYDAMKEERALPKETDRLKRTPKYVVNLLKMAEERKKEDDRRNERKIQKEREEEGDEFADKEAFVTSAYKDKLKEMSAAAEEERLQKLKEDADDVTKKSDLTGFYRNILDDKTRTYPLKTTETSDSSSNKRHFRQRSRSPPSDQEEAPSKSRKSDPKPKNDDRPDKKPHRSRSSSPKIAADSKSALKSEREIERSHRPRKDRSRSKSPAKRDRDRDRDHHDRKRSRRDSSRERPNKREPSHSEPKEDEAKENSPHPQSQEGPRPPSPQPLLTRSERIRRILAKRTVGGALEEAMERFRKRRDFIKSQGLKLYQIASLPSDLYESIS